MSGFHDSFLIIMKQLEPLNIDCLLSFKVPNRLTEINPHKEIKNNLYSFSSSANTIEFKWKIEHEAELVLTKINIMSYYDVKITWPRRKKSGNTGITIAHQGPIINKHSTVLFDNSEIIKTFINSENDLSRNAT